MGEREPSPEQSLEAVQLNGRSLADWFRWLTHDPNGEDIGFLRVPCSRYGSTGRECARFALAAEWVAAEASGAADDPEASMMASLGLAVNDDRDLGLLVLDYYAVLPPVLAEMVGTEDELRELMGEAP